MKNFIYCDYDVGGMDTDMFSSSDYLTTIYAWMKPKNVEEDNNLINFVESAEIGDIVTHRKGFCIRLKDK